MNLEARPIVFEDMVRQIIACGYRKRPEELLQEIGMFVREILRSPNTLFYSKIDLVNYKLTFE